MTGGGGSTVVRRQLGLKLRRLRVGAGKSLADVEVSGLASRAKINRIENGRLPVKLADVRALCWLYGADNTTTEALAALVPGTQQQGWLETYSDVVVPDFLGLYVGLEQSADQLRCFDPGLVHGLLQIEDYARALISSEDTLEPKVVDQRVAFRLERQHRVMSGSPRLSIVLGAAALSVIVGSSDIMAAQLSHLRDMAQQPNICVRIWPWASGPYPVQGSFALLDFDSEEDPSVAYTEFPMGARYVEQASQVREYERVFGVLTRKSTPIEEWKP